MLTPMEWLIFGVALAVTAIVLAVSLGALLGD